MHTTHVYISRRGNIVSSMFILIRRLAMPLFCGRKATCLTSFFVALPMECYSQVLHQ